MKIIQKKPIYIYTLKKFFSKINFWPINLCHVTDDSHTPTCKLLESSSVKDIKVMNTKNFSQSFADLCKFFKTFLNHLFPLRHLSHRGFLFSNTAGIFRFHKVYLCERERDHQSGCMHTCIQREALLNA